MFIKVTSVQVVHGTALALMLVGVAGLVGWYADVHVLLTYGAQGTPLRYNAALAFAMLAAAMLLMVHSWSRLAVATTLVPASIGWLTVAQYVLGVDLGVDLLFFGGYSHAPRMSPNAAFAIAAAGTALIGLMFGGTHRLSVAAGAVTGAAVSAIGITAAFGYLVGLPTTYLWQGLTPLSPPGALGVSLLGAALMALAWSQSVHQEQPVPAWLPFPIGMLVTTTGVVMWQAVVAQEHSADQATRTSIHEVLPAAVLVVVTLLAVILAAMVFLYLRLLQQRRELTAAEQRAVREAALLQEVLNVLPVGVWVTDASGDIVKTNPAGVGIWSGAPRVGVDGYEEYKGWWPDTGVRLKSTEWALARAFLTGETVQNEMVDIEGFDGARKTTLNSAAPLREGDRIVGAVVAVQDITKRREAEKALERRTQDLARSNADLEQFAYIASHDLQEPLRMVASFTQLLARRYKGKLDQDADEYIAFVVDGALRMQRLLSDLLEYSRVGTRGRSLMRIQAGDAARDALANLALAIDEARAKVTVDPLPDVLADRAQLTQVFQNLVANALKFRADGRPPEIRISGISNGDQVQLTVSDNGIGIEQRHGERIFEIFRRLDTSGRYPGTGLGLAICKRIVARHGGVMWVESQPGVGSRFHFTVHAPGTQSLQLLEQTA